ADAVCAIANAPDPEAAIHEALGEDVGVVEYIRPGFELSRRVADLADRRAVVLAHHGLVTWGESHEESYGLTLELVERARAYLEARGAQLYPYADVDVQLHHPTSDAGNFVVRLRGRVSRDQRQVLAVDAAQRDLADRPDLATIAAERGTPDHMLRIGSRSCVLADGIDESVGAFERESRA